MTDLELRTRGIVADLESISRLLAFREKLNIGRPGYRLMVATIRVMGGGSVTLIWLHPDHGYGHWCQRVQVGICGTQIKACFDAEGRVRFENLPLGMKHLEFVYLEEPTPQLSAA